MRFGIQTLDEFEVSGKTVLCRVDINQPVDREHDTLKSIARIRACVPTVKELSEKGAKVVLLAHQGSDIEYKNFYCTRPHAKVLTELLGRRSDGSMMSAAPRRAAPLRLCSRVRFCCWTTCGLFRRSRRCLK